MNTEEPKRDFVGFRCLIKGRLKTTSFLHIGSEKPTVLHENDEQKIAAQESDFGPDEDEKKEATPIPVVVGSSGEAVIPATALRGAIRSRLMRLDLDGKLAKDLMGTAHDDDTGGGSALDQTQGLQADGEQSSKGSARRVFIQTSAIVEPCPATIVFDDPMRCVDKIAMTAISRWRRAPQDEMLRSVEAVPPGVEFSVSIGISGSKDNDGLVTADEIAAVLWSLGGRQAGPGGQTDLPPEDAKKLLSLGAFQKAGWGRVEWTTCKITTLTEHGLQRWLAAEPDVQTGNQGWAICSEPVDVERVWSAWKQGPNSAITDAESHGRDLVTLSLTLNCQSTFFTEDQRSHTKDAAADAAARAAENDTDQTPAKLAKVMRVDGKAWLSGQSLKGALRSQFERLLRTRGIPCCDPTFIEDKEQRAANHGAVNTENSRLNHPADLTLYRCEPIHSESELGRLCPACQIFGAGGWASTIELSEFQEMTPSEDERREFLAISRFTGGGVPHLKFSADVAVQPKLRGSIRIDMRRLGFQPKEEKDSIGIPSLDAKLGALLHLFRDFAEGDIPIGAGRSKGFGTFKVEAPSVESRLDSKGKAFADVVESMLAGKDVPDEHAKTADIWLSVFDSSAPAKSGASEVAGTPAQPVTDPWIAISGQLQNQAQPAQRPFKVQGGSYNPYHWVPAVPAPAELRIPTQTLHQKKEHRHDLYAQDGICGEIQVTIQPHTPIFVGGHRTSKGELNKPGVVEHFKIKGADAIPSTSLRGLLSSTYEMATASAMRGLEAETIYTHRMDLGDENPVKPFDFIGKVVKQAGELVVIPWARRPGAAKKDGTLTNAKDIKGIKMQPPAWERVKCKNIGLRDVLPNSYRLSDATRSFPPGRENEIRFCGEPANQDQHLTFAPDVLKRFHRMADERTKATKDEAGYAVQPYEPLKQERGGEGAKYRVKEGDFLYFDTQDGKTASRIALAQVWRDDVRKSLRELFKDKNLLPLDLDWGSPGAARTDLTMVETAFGVVLQARGKKKKEQAKMKIPFPAYASKIIVTDAILANGGNGEVNPVGANPEILKVLSAPKPPSPAYYFEPVSRSQTYELATFQQIRDGNVRPRGRKMYLHLDWDKNKTVQPWVSKDPPVGTEHYKKLADQRKMQVKVQCLGIENRFTFNIKFDNLTQDEFLALCYTLRPTPDFRHKLGMAKPLGLGSVSFDVTAIRRVDRRCRYTSEGFKADRFTGVPEPSTQANAWIDGCSVQWRKKNNTALKKIFEALETIGTTAVETMQYPMTREQLRSGNPDREWELFKWPSENRKTAVKKHGGAIAQTMLPIAPPAQGVEEEKTFLIPRTPSPCYVVIVTGREKADAAEVKGYTTNAIKTEIVASGAEAAAKIKTLPSDAVVYLISQGGAGRVEYHGRCVKRIELKSMQDPRDKNDNENRLSRLREALALGALCLEATE